jgi:hypothetical protein
MYRLTRTFNEDKQRMEVTNREKIEISKHDKLEKKQQKLQFFKTYYGGVFELESYPAALESK